MLSKNAYKKAKKYYDQQQRKAANLKKAEEEHQRILHEKLANAIEIEEDSKLDIALKVHVDDITTDVALLGKRVELSGWVHAYRKQAKLMFIELRDGTGIPPIIQCVFNELFVCHTHV